MEFGICFVTVLVGIMLLIAWIGDQIDKSKTRKSTSNYSSGYSGTLHSPSDNIQDSRKSTPGYSRENSGALQSGSDNIQDYGINEIRSSGKFTPAERAAEYRRRRKSPSGVIDGVYNDAYRGNGSYNDSYRDWDANA